MRNGKLPMALLETSNKFTRTARLIGDTIMFVDLDQDSDGRASTGLFLKPSLLYVFMCVSVDVHMYLRIKRNVQNIRFFLPPTSTKIISPLITLNLRSLCMILFIKKRLLNLHTLSNIPVRLWYMRRGHMLRSKAKIM